LTKSKSSEAKPDTIEEDGNTDYCFICNLGGGLLCCDKCPRAFHPACLNINEEDLGEGDWHCPRCDLDGKQLESDVMTGAKNRKIMKKLKITLGSENYDNLYAVCWEAVQFLCNFDFGYAFSAPVDLKFCPDYRDHIKRPMDYSTIMGKLETNFYLKEARSTSRDFFGGRKYTSPSERINLGEFSAADKAFVLLLRDINTVFHNCIKYNFDGSAIARMGEVQSSRFKHIFRCSIEDHVNSRVKVGLRVFLEEMRDERNGHVSEDTEIEKLQLQKLEKVKEAQRLKKKEDAEKNNSHLTNGKASTNGKATKNGKGSAGSRCHQCIEANSFLSKSTYTAVPGKGRKILVIDLVNGTVLDSIESCNLLRDLLNKHLPKHQHQNKSSCHNLVTKGIPIYCKLGRMKEKRNLTFAFADLLPEGVMKVQIKSSSREFLRGGAALEMEIDGDSDGNE